MSLYNGIDPTAIASLGVYTETYGAGEGGNIANLVASLGLFEDAPDFELPVPVGRRSRWILKFMRIRR